MRMTKFLVRTKGRLAATTSDLSREACVALKTSKESMIFVAWHFVRRRTNFYLVNEYGHVSVLVTKIR